jgi:hypothetical protein
VTGYAEICRRYGAEPVYLDEGPTVEVALRDGTRARVSRRLYEEIIQRGSNFYLALPKLKTHSMATVTLGVKNQQAFPVDADRMKQHSHGTLHRRLAALYTLTRPDLCYRGTPATAHGHFPPTALLDECLVPMNILIGGPDTLAVNVVGAKVLGYDLLEVEHLQLCAEWGLGEADLSLIQVQAAETKMHPAARTAASTPIWLRHSTDRLPHSLLRRFHPDVRWVIGRTKACVEGCRGNSEAIQEMLFNDYDGRGGWTLVCGSGFEESDLENLPGDILIVGPCACEEVGDKLVQRYPRRRIYRVNEHNDLMSNTRYQARLMGVTPVQMVPLNPLVSAFTLLQAKLHGLTARVPPLLG